MTSSPSAPRSGVTGPQMWRQTKLRQWLLEGRRFTASDAATAFEVSRRTIMTDLEYLRQYGYVIEWNPARHTYELAEESGDLTALQLRRSEWAAISLAAHVFESMGAAPIAETVHGIVDRARSLMPDLLGTDPTGFAPSLSVVRGPAPKRPMPFLEELSRAVEEQRTVDMTYHTMSRGTTTDRSVNPFRILSRDGHGYLVGWCHTRRDVLIFRMDRIRSVELTSTVFAIPPDFDLGAFLGPMFGMFRDPEVFHVKVRFSPWVARWIREEVWHPSQTLTDLPDGSVQVDLSVTGLEDVRRWILGFGEQAEVLEPLRLRAEIADAARVMLTNYGR